ncbi:MAG: hypothetical protein WD048_06195, partial [Chitinophagales bacterium]
SGDTLFLSDGGFVLLDSVGTDDQVISISNDTVYLEDGGFVRLPEGFSGDYNDLTNAPTNVSSFVNDVNYVTTTNLPDADSTNELQNIFISGDTLFLSDGGFVVLDSIGTDDQVISISNDTVYLEDGGFVKLPEGFSGDYNDLTNAPTNVSSFVNDVNYITNSDISDNDSTNELQNLQGFINGTVLTIAINDGDSAIVNLAGLIDGLDADSTNELQNISISGDTIFLSDGGSILLPSGTVNTDDQILSIQNDSLFIEDGNGLPLSLLSDSLWLKNGNDIYNANTGNVGIGTMTPDHKLQVIGSASFGADNHSVTGDRSIAFGEENTVSNSNSIVGGYQSYTNGGNSIAIGWADSITDFAVGA